MSAAEGNGWRKVTDDITHRVMSAMRGESIDAAGLFPALAEALRSSGVAAVGPLTRFATGMVAAAAGAGATLLGAEDAGPVPVDRSDRRFGDPTWRRNPLFNLQLQAYLVGCRLLDDLVDAAPVSEVVAAKASIAADLLKAATAPTNFLWGNPEALKRAFQTGGASVLAGFTRFLEDARRNGGFPSQVEPGAFAVGTDLAATPGKVVFRNDLIELIQYQPQTEQVHAIPLLCSPPWINKYYIMDLAPGRSLIEWAVRHGHTTFAISYRNPDSSMAEVSFEDYLFEGLLAAMDVVEDITGQPKVNILALCLGGTLAAILMGYLAGGRKKRVNAVTLLNTLTDFDQAGILKAFTDETTLDRLEGQLTRAGTLESASMRRTFDVLRPQDLIFNYIGPRWLMGDPPPSFDILTWNADGTAMPAAMHVEYLRSCYVDNRLANGTMEFGGRRVDLARVAHDVFVVGAENDHIAPWRAAYRVTQLMPKSKVRFLLSSAGHIAGVVNPPSPKARYRTNDTNPPQPDDWLDGATRVDGSWWEAWAEWIGERAGKTGTPPPMGSERFPAIADAPGEYVLG